MAAAGDSELDRLLSQAASSVSGNVDSEHVNRFIEKVNAELDGYLIAARLLGYRIQSPQERESLAALSITEECVNRCGKRFQSEIGKFRFLNEMIKMVSPKYYGERTSQRVKDKIIKLMYKWSQSLRHEPKVADAYEMLKKQGVIDDDPLLEEEPYHPPPRKEQPSLFDDDKAKLLAKLLRSKHSEDFQAANRLIKNMVKQDEEKQEKVSQRFIVLETIKNNVRLLREMLDCYNPASTSMPDNDVIKELYQNLERERPKIFKLASETDEKDMDAMGKILSANDDVVQVMTSYKHLLGDQQQQHSQKSGDILLDLNATPTGKKDSSTSLTSELAGLDLSASGASAAVVSVVAGQSATAASSDFADFASAASDDMSLASPPLVGTVSSSPARAPHVNHNAALSDIFSTSPLAPTPTSVGGLGMTPFSSAGTTLFSYNSSGSNVLSDDNALLSLSGDADAFLEPPLLPTSGLAGAKAADMGKKSTELDVFGRKSQALHELDSFGKDLLEKSRPAMQVIAPPQPPAVKLSLNQLKASLPSGPATAASPGQLSMATAAVVGQQGLQEVSPLTSIFVALESIQPGSLPSLTVYDKNKIKIVLHFGKDSPRPDIQVMVLSIMSTCASPLKNLVFQVAVPKIMKVKLQPPSATELPAFNPILPPTAVTQVMLLANPNKEKVKLKFKISYVLDGALASDTGDVLNFPDY